MAQGIENWESLKIELHLFRLENRFDLTSRSYSESVSVRFGVKVGVVVNLLLR